MPQNCDELIHVVVIGSENRNAGNLFGDRAAGDGVEALRGDEDGEHAMLLPKRACRADKSIDVVFVLAIRFGTGFVEIDRAILAFFVGSGGDARDIFCKRRFHRPHERMNRAKNQHGCFFVPSGIAQCFAAICVGMRFEGPGGVGSEFGGNAEFAEHGLRFHISRNDQRMVDVARTHSFNERVHVAGLSAVANGQFIF